MFLWCFPPSFGSIQLTVWEEMSFEEFQDGGHLGHWNVTILAILNLYVASMLPIKFLLNPTYGLGGDVLWRISRWPPWRSSWISERNHFSNSESPMLPQCFPLNFSSIQHMILEETSKMWKANDGRQTTGHGISWPGANLQVSYSCKHDCVSM